MKNAYDEERASSHLDPGDQDRAEERKSMLRASTDFQEISLADPPPRRRRWPLPLSLAANLVLFLVVLLQLSHPCLISARTCTYAKRETAPAEPQKALVEGPGPLMSDANGIVPEFATERVTFLNDSRYANEAMFAAPATFRDILSRWRADMPAGRGFITVANSSAYPYLQRPWKLRGYPGDGYSIAYLHQYHCLFMILKAHGNLRLGLDDKHMHADPKEAERHVTHCFDYLRQSLYCAGDSALEGKSGIAGVEMTDGWGDTHVCKKRDKQLAWVVENRLSDKAGID